MSTRNPSNNTVVQVLLELKDSNMGNLSVDGLLALSERNPKLLKTIGDRIDARGYSNSKVVFTKLTTDQRLMRLSPEALKVLVLLGCNCAQNGCVSVKNAVLLEATGMSRDVLRAAIKELMETGALTTVYEQRHHEAAVWQVNPELMSVGKSKLAGKRKAEFDIRSKAVNNDKYLLSGELELVLHKENVHFVNPDGTSLTFNRLTLESIQKEPSSKNGTDSSATNANATISEPDGQETLDEFQSYARWS